MANPDGLGVYSSALTPLGPPSRSAGGHWHRFTHASESCDCTMSFSLYVPETTLRGRESRPRRGWPVVYFLSGMTCTDENFPLKAGAAKRLNQRGVACVVPDVSPRGTGVPLATASYDIGEGAGFYIDAVQEPWNKHFRMYTYVNQELPAVLDENFQGVLDLTRVSVMGHSMGGHGALVLALRNPAKYRSVSCFAPICHPMESPWGRKAFETYLGEDTSEWHAYDAVRLMTRFDPYGLVPPMLIDQGADDRFAKDQLKLDAFAQVATARLRHSVSIRLHEGYDHSYHFISTFVDDHIDFHADKLAHIPADVET